MAQVRDNYGSERYEKSTFQARVAQCFEALKDDTWKVMDASRSIEDIHTEVYGTVQKVIKEKTANPIGQLWKDQRPHTTTYSPEYIVNT